MTERKNNARAECRGTVFYDGSCQMCTDSATRLRPWLESRAIVVAPFENGAAEPEMRLTWHDGRIFGGADAILFLARQFWFTFPLAVVARLPGLKSLADAGYRLVAGNVTAPTELAPSI